MLVKNPIPKKLKITIKYDEKQGIRSYSNSVIVGMLKMRLLFLRLVNNFFRPDEIYKSLLFLFHLHLLV